MTKAHAERQIERAKFLRDIADINRAHAKRLEAKANDMELEALHVLSDDWAREHAPEVEQ